MNETEAHRLLTPQACRAARALLGWAISDLVREAGTSPNAISRLENGGSVRSATALKIVTTFARHGVEITNGDGTGVRLTKR